MHVLVVLAVVFAACSRPIAAPREARNLRICPWPSSPAKTCECLIAHVKKTIPASRALTCAAGPEVQGPRPSPWSVVLIRGARRPLAYLIRTDDHGQQVIAELPGQPGMELSVEAGPPIEWYSGKLVEITSAWSGGKGGFERRTLCVVETNDPRPPSCAFTTLIARWSITGYSRGSDAIPSFPLGPRQAWSVAIDRKYGVALVVQVRGELDPDVPIGAFQIQPGF